MALKQFWIVVIVVMFFLGFMIGYSIPPFMEVGMGQGKNKALIEEEGSVSSEEQEIMKQYKQMLQGGESEEE